MPRAMLNLIMHVTILQDGLSQAWHLALLRHSRRRDSDSSIAATENEVGIYAVCPHSSWQQHAADSCHVTTLRRSDDVGFISI